ncbi:MAG: FAD/NAD(P)-binding protein [Alphaproteobacteria bacterium]
MPKSDPKAAPAQLPFVIVGCGFAGTSVLLHTLLRVADDPSITAPVDIRIVERREEQKHAGLAYGKAPDYKKHNLNIGAKRVNPFPAGAQPEGFPTFVDYIQDLSKKNPEMRVCLTNPPRQLYGDYLQHLVGLAVDKAGSKVRVSYVMAQATRVNEHKNHTTITLDGNETIKCAHVVLATGFQDALAPKFAAAAANSPRFIETPYSKSANDFFAHVCQHKNSDVLVIGTGLTSMDIAARLINSGHEGKITMMSRRALMHKPYEETPVEEYIATRLRGEPRPESELPFTKTPPAFMQAETVPAFVKAVIKEFKQLTRQGFTSEEVITYWERFVPQIAEKLPKDQLAKLFAQHDVLLTTSRVGVTPDIGRTVRQAMQSGRIKVVSASIQSIREVNGKMETLYNPSPSPENLITRIASVLNLKSAPAQRVGVHDFVFSGMGNSISYDPEKSVVRDPLWRDLLENGKAKPHWTKAGVTVTNGFSLVDTDGRAAKGISVIGVPVAGHMTVTAYKYPERPGAGGRIGPTALNVAGITGATLAFLDQNYDRLMQGFRRPAPKPANVKPPLEAAKPKFFRPHSPI